MSWTELENLDKRISEVEATRPFRPKQEIELLRLYRERFVLEAKMEVISSEEDVFDDLLAVEHEMASTSGDPLLVLQLKKEFLEGVLWELSSLREDLNCPYCKSDNIVHNTCGQKVPCDCPTDDPDYYCNDCHASFIETAYTGQSFASAEEAAVNDMNQYYAEMMDFHTCSHINQKVTLAGGTVVTATAAKNIQSLEVRPDFGLYADRAWILIAAWRNEFVNWPDMHIPAHNIVAIAQIKGALVKAQEGRVVDVGCIGGHGRTGTILAIMNMLDSDGKVGALESIEYIRKIYCKKAVETSHQEWFVQWAESHIFARPEPKAWSGVDIIEPCILTDHVAMKFRGYVSCQYNPDCGNFKVDIARWETGEVPWADEVARKKMNQFDLEYGGEKLDTDSSHICQPAEHYAMYLLGNDKCLWYPEDCGYWNNDMQELKTLGTMDKKPINSLDIKDLLTIYAKEK